MEVNYNSIIERINRLDNEQKKRALAYLCMLEERELKEKANSIKGNKES